MPKLIGHVHDKQMIVNVNISKPGEIKKVLAGKFPKDELTVFQTAGLIDTGATASCVSPAVIKELGLQPTGKTRCQGVSGIHEAFTYEIDLTLSGDGKNNCYQNLTVTELNVPPESRFQVLIGMDIIMQCLFTLSPDTHFVLSV